jgi:hypothetical protein
VIAVVLASTVAGPTRSDALSGDESGNEWNDVVLGVHGVRD